MIAIIIFLILSLIYNGYVISKYGVPVSLSDTSYLFGGNKRYFFTGYCYASAFLLIPVLMEAVPATLTFLPFLMCAGLLFSGASPFFKGDGLDKPVHYVSSIISFISFFVFMIVLMGWWWVLAFLVLFASLCIWKRKSYIYFAEMLAFLFVSIFTLL